MSKLIISDTPSDTDSFKNVDYAYIRHFKKDDNGIPRLISNQKVVLSTQKPVRHYSTISQDSIFDLNSTGRKTWHQVKDFSQIPITTTVMIVVLTGKILYKQAFPLLRIARIKFPALPQKKRKITIPYPGKPGLILSARYDKVTRGIMRSANARSMKHSIILDISISKGRNINLGVSTSTIRVSGVKEEETAREAVNHLLDNVKLVQQELDYMNQNMKEAKATIAWIKDQVKGPEYVVEPGTDNIAQFPDPIKTIGNAIEEAKLRAKFKLPNMSIKDDIRTEISNTITEMLTPYTVSLMARLVFYLINPEHIDLTKEIGLTSGDILKLKEYCEFFIEQVGSDADMILAITPDSELYKFFRARLNALQALIKTSFDLEVAYYLYAHFSKCKELSELDELIVDRINLRIYMNALEKANGLVYPTNVSDCPKEIDSRLVKFFLEYLLDFRRYDYYCLQLDWILTIDRILDNRRDEERDNKKDEGKDNKKDEEKDEEKDEGKDEGKDNKKDEEKNEEADIEDEIKIKTVQLALVNHSFRLGFEINRIQLARNINGRYGFVVEHDPTFNTSVTVNWYYILPEEYRDKVVKKRHQGRVTFIVYKGGTVTLSGPYRKLNYHAYNLFQQAIREIYSKIIRKNGDPHPLKLTLRNLPMD